MSDAIDLLPGLDDQFDFDGNNNDFVKDYILGNPLMYREEYNPVSCLSICVVFCCVCIVLVFNCQPSPLCPFRSGVLIPKFNLTHNL